MIWTWWISRERERCLVKEPDGTVKLPSLSKLLSFCNTSNKKVTTPSVSFLRRTTRRPEGPLKKIYHLRFPFRSVRTQTQTRRRVLRMITANKLLWITSTNYQGTQFISISICHFFLSYLMGSQIFFYEYLMGLIQEISLAQWFQNLNRSFEL